MERLDEMIRSKSYKERASVAKSPLATEDMLWELARDSHWSVRKEVANNPNATLEIILEIIAKDGNRLMDIPRIRNLDLEEIQIIFKDEKLKGFVAKHPNTSAILLEELAQHENVFVRWDVAQNANTSPEVLAKLAEDPSFDVRRAVAQNPNTPKETLEWLAMDLVAWVRDVARAKLA